MDGLWALREQLSVQFQVETQFHRSDITEPRSDSSHKAIKVKTHHLCKSLKSNPKQDQARREKVAASCAVFLGPKDER